MVHAAFTTEMGESLLPVAERVGREAGEVGSLYTGRRSIEQCLNRVIRVQGENRQTYRC